MASAGERRVGRARSSWITLRAGAASRERPPLCSSVFGPPITAPHRLTHAAAMPAPDTNQCIRVTHFCACCDAGCAVRGCPSVEWPCCRVLAR